MTLLNRAGRTGRQIAERIQEERSLRRRQPPVVHLAAGDATPTIYYLCPDDPAPAGGVRTIYRHVDILNASGRRAAVLHHRDGYACRWFEHSTPTVGAPSARLCPNDLLIVPEWYGPFVDRLPRELTLVGFNQNAYLTFLRHAGAPRVSYDRFEAMLTVSPDSAAYLRFAFPGLEVSVLDYAVDPAVFFPSQALPPKCLALMPRKRPDDARHVLQLLGDRLRGWEVVVIENASEQEAAGLLRSAPIFLAFGQQEGFGLPAAEAMAAGGYVIGFSGFGGRDMFDPIFSAPIEDGDVLSMARATADALTRYEQDPMAIRAAGARASEFVRQRYSIERLHFGLLAFYEGIGCRASTSPAASPAA